MDFKYVVYSESDTEELAENIEKLIKDKDFYNIVMQRCIERSKLYDIENMLRAYINVYIELEEVEIKRK